MNATAHSVRVESSMAVRNALVSGCEALGITWVGIARGLRLASTTVVDRWHDTREHEGVEEPVAPFPAWPLSEPEAIPDPLYHRIVGTIEARRILRGAGIRGTAEGTGFSVLVHASEAIAELSRALADHKISPAEVPSVRAVLHRLAGKIEILLHLLDAIERPTGSLRVVPG